MKKYLKLLVIVLSTFVVVILQSCSKKEKSEPYCYAGEVSTKWRVLTDYYYLEATIYNSGNGDATSVYVYYNYINQHYLKKVEDAQYIGGIEAGKSVIFQSPLIYAPEAIVNCKISKVEYQ